LATGGAGAEAVTLDGTGSSDPDGTIASYAWSDGGTPLATGATPTVPLALGVHTITLTVTDNDGLTDTATLTVTVGDFVGGAEIIVDNLDPNSVATGAWQQSSGPNPWEVNSVYNDIAGTTFRWLPAVTVAGEYEVYAWWTYHENRSSNVPYRIGHDGAVDTVAVDQHDTGLGGQWNLLGSYTFDAGGGEYVEVSADNGQASADAVKLVLSSPANQPPVANAGSDQTLADSDGSGSETVTLDGTGSTDDGTIALYEWSDNLGDPIADGSGPTPTLIVGEHTITLTVTDNDGATDTDIVVVTVEPLEPSYGVAVTPATAALSGAPGATVPYTLTVTNNGNVPDTFTVAVSGNAWTTTPAPSPIGPIAAGGTGELTVNVVIPGAAADGASDAATIALTSQGDGTATDSSTLTTTAVAPPASFMHVGDLDGSGTLYVGNGPVRWKADVVVAVEDGDSSPVAGATVTGNFTPKGGNGRSCTTDAIGRCTIQSRNIQERQATMVTFTVTGVTDGSRTYDSVANDDPDIAPPEDVSTGTVIFVDAP